MVSRFPNGSPFNYNSQDRIVATFNREFSRDELLGKLSCIIFDSLDGVFLLATKVSQPEDETIVRMSTPVSAGPELDLQIEGNNLVVSDEFSDGWLFDIDFDSQHRKFFEQVSANYLIQLPNFVGQGALGTRYAIAQVVNNLESTGELTVNLAVNDAENYEPIAADAELTDIDAASWFNYGAGSSNFAIIADLMKEIIKMEYDIPSGVDFYVFSTTSAEWTVDGGLWNLFTDGSVYVPLVMTSRFPDGSPVKTNGLLATFNRTPYSYELITVTKAVCSHQTYGISEVALILNNDHLMLRVAGADCIVLIDNNSIKISEDTSGLAIYDVDFDNQHQRTLNITDPSGNEDWANLIINNPEMINDTPYQFMLAMNIMQNIKSVVVPVNQSSEIKVFNPTNNTVTYRQSEMQTAALVQLVAKIIEMEFGSSVDVSSQIINDDLPIDTFNLLTDSDVILPS